MVDPKIEQAQALWSEMIVKLREAIVTYPPLYLPKGADPNRTAREAACDLNEEVMAKIYALAPTLPFTTVTYVYGMVVEGDLEGFDKLVSNGNPVGQITSWDYRPDEFVAIWNELIEQLRQAAGAASDKKRRKLSRAVAMRWNEEVAPFMSESPMCIKAYFDFCSLDGSTRMGLDGFEKAVALTHPPSPTASLPFPNPFF